MNWFERYGIVGLYFVGSVAVWDWVLHGSSGLVASREAEKVALLLATLALPAGYVLSITTQLLYYVGSPFWGIHRWALKELLGVRKHDVAAEVQLAISIRANATTEHLERGRWVQNFNSRRWDVLSINNSIILSTALAPALIWAAGSGQSIAPGEVKAMTAACVALLIVAICIISSCVMTYQIRETLKASWVANRPDLDGAPTREEED